VGFVFGGIFAVEEGRREVVFFLLPLQLQEKVLRFVKKERAGVAYILLVFTCICL
jgi:hypothetical protein